MGDLIDRSSLSELSFSHAIHQDCIVYVPFGEVKRQIKDAPIAYDVEAVVAAIKTKHCKKCRNILGIAGAEEYCKEQKCEIEGVCEIVRNSGKE